MYNKEEIKLIIDEAIQTEMYHKDKTEWNIIISVQAQLYELFGIEE